MVLIVEKMKQTRKNADVSKLRKTLKRSIANTQRLGIFSSLFLTYRTDDNRIYIFFWFITKRVRHAHANENKKIDRENSQSTLYKKKKERAKNEK
jgi:hypothetical protein